MYFPKFVIKNNGVPILSKKELEIMAENFLKDFKTETLIKPQAIDIDDFAFNYLGLKLDFHHLSHDESILGAMVFDDTVIPVYNPESNKAEYSVIDKETVVIDSSLLRSIRKEGIDILLDMKWDMLFFIESILSINHI